MRKKISELKMSLQFALAKIHADPTLADERLRSLGRPTITEIQQLRQTVRYPIAGGGELSLLEPPSVITKEDLAAFLKTEGLHLKKQEEKKEGSATPPISPEDMDDLINKAWEILVNFKEQHRPKIGKLDESTDSDKVNAEPDVSVDSL